MERLDVGMDSAYSDTELALHLSRYLPIKPLCRRARVLDIAGGAGYAAHIMRNHWGAARVFAVDVSDDAIATAEKEYDAPGLKFIKADAVRYLNNTRARFNLVVSVETIEHVSDPEAFLHGIKRVCEPGAAVYISAPNDIGYYGAGPSLNPHHRHVFSYDEFIELGTKVFGPPSQVMLGTTASGFAAVDATDSAPASWAEAIESSAGPAAAAFVPSTGVRPITPEGALFYAALWGGPADGPRLAQAAAVFGKERTFRIPSIGISGSGIAADGRSSAVVLIPRQHEAMKVLRHVRKALAPKIDLTLCPYTANNVGRVLSTALASGPTQVDLWGEEAVRAYFDHEPAGEQAAPVDSEYDAAQRQPSVSCVLDGRPADHRALSSLLAFVDDALFLDEPAPTSRDERLRFAQTILLHLDRAEHGAGRGGARRRAAFLRAQRRAATLERQLVAVQRELSRLSGNFEVPPDLHRGSR